MTIGPKTLLLIGAALVTTMLAASATITLIQTNPM